MFINKKILLSTIIPLISSLGFIKHENSIQEYKIMVNYNGQADVLLSLQIPTDYYPYQFKKTTLYDYLTNIDKYIISNSNVSQNKVKIKNNLQKKLNQLLSQIKEFGPSLWNEDLYETGIVFRNDQFWNSKKTALLFLEQFIADDYVDINDSYHLLPAHKTLIITNYRAARDPFTIFSPEIFKCFEDSECNDNVGKELKKYINNYNLTEINSLYRFGKYIGFWNKLSKLSDISKHIKKFTNQQDNKLFSLNATEDQQISEKYKKIIFSKEELEKLKEWSKTKTWNMNYQNQSSIQLTHHPALEQQIIPGTAPLAEGSQKDIMIFLYQFATLINEYIKQPIFKTEFKNDYRKLYMENALTNAKKISQNADTRISNIRKYFKKIQVVDSNFDPENNCFSTTNSKTFGIVTYPPSSFGAGEATIQSMSKFPFIYRDIGLKQPIPNNLQTDLEENQETFSVDDNGWWWKIGNINLDASQLMSFSKTSNTILVLANEDDWNILRDDSSNTLKAISEINKQDSFTLDISKINATNYSVHYQKYHLWNEGLRSPLALNLLLDNLVDIFQKQYDSSFSNSSEEYKSAMDWGDYWDNTFISETN